MSSKSRYFVIASLLVLTVGLGTGLVAYYGGFPTTAFTRQSGPDELRFVPATAAVVAFANVHDIMTSDIRQRIRVALPAPPHGQQDFQNQTGINIETDIDRVVTFMSPRDGAGPHGIPGSGMVLARGRFDAVKIESLMREHGGAVEEYKGRRLIVADPSHGNGGSVSLAFLEPGLVAIGTSDAVRGAVDLNDGGPSIITNDDMMDRVSDLDSSSAWVAGRFDVLISHAKLPSEVATRLPPITWFSANVDVNGGLRGTMRADTRDEESANNLRDVLRGFMALAKMQAGSQPQLEGLVQSLQLAGTGKTVSMSFDVPSEVFDAIAALANQHRAAQPPPQQ
jgi:hypothetical protein